MLVWDSNVTNKAKGAEDSSNASPKRPDSRQALMALGPQLEESGLGLDGRKSSKGKNATKARRFSFTATTAAMTARKQAKKDVKPTATTTAIKVNTLSLDLP